MSRPKGKKWWAVCCVFRYFGQFSWESMSRKNLMNVFFFLQAFCIMGYVPSVILFHYIVSFTFKSIQNTKEFWSFIFPTVSKRAEPNLFFPFIQMSNFVYIYIFMLEYIWLHFFKKLNHVCPYSYLVYSKHRVYLSIFSELHLLQWIKSLFCPSHNVLCLV